MSATILCNQRGCGKPAVALYTWPGKDEAGICSGHTPWLRRVANAMGLHVQLTPIVELAPDDGDTDA